jgi:hypothetical protein
MLHNSGQQIPQALAEAVRRWRTRPESLKAISITQPWSFCITNGTKRLENRTWHTSERGWKYIHAGKKYQTGIEHAINADSPEMDVIDMRRSPRGGIVGIARLVDCIDVAVGSDGQRRIGNEYVSDRIAHDQRIWSAKAPWIDDKRMRQYAFVFADPWPLPEPIAYPGELGFFNIAQATVKLINDMLFRATIREE